ncbi:DUF4214 domain-containing protein [Pseudomonas aestiva]|uniref:DUF4214 domain-containing protein n=1 Tax=Pseudomonas aestiva TaxID=3136739 RepID=UPI0032632EE1
MPTTRETISAYYQSILGRTPDAAGLDYWTAQVDQGTASLAQVATGFSLSTEAASSRVPVVALYLSSFGRLPDTEGLQYWTQALQNGTPLEAIQQAFLQSPEFATMAAGSATAFLTAAYENALGRPADADGLQFWTQQLAAGTSRTEVLAALADSPEGQPHALAKAQLSLAYLGVSGTPPSLTELNDLLAQQGQQSLIELVTRTTEHLIDNAAPAPAPAEPQPAIFTFTPEAGTQAGASDASGVIRWGQYLIVGDDEGNVLRVYDQQGGQALDAFDYGSVLGLSDELDFEAMTFTGSLGTEGTLYLTGSHSNSKSGKEAPGREAILAVKLTTDAQGKPVFDTTGIQTYKGLVAALDAWDASGSNGKPAGYYGLKVSSAAGIAPEHVNGFSIEGLTTSPDDSQLWLGFRAPQLDTGSRDKALLIAVTNYQAVLADNSLSPTFEAMELNLGGRGIRSIDRALDGSGYLILAGPAGSASAAVTHDFRLFTWSGDPATAPFELDNNLDALLAATGGSFESIASPTSVKSGTEILLLQDNGDTIWQGQTQVSKDLGPAQQHFQGNLVTLGTPAVDLAAPLLVASNPAVDARDVSTGSRLSLTFDEGIALGSGSLQLVDQAGTVVQVFKAGDPGVAIDFNVLNLTPTDRLQASSSYHLEMQAGAVVDHAGNAVAAMDISFATAARPHYSLLITEVNSNAKSGDFFELYNYGSTSIDLSGWRMTDEAGQFSSAITLDGNSVLAAGATLVVADVAAANLSAFKTAWGLSGATSVVSVDGAGLGKEDAVMLFDKLGNVAAAFNYDLTAVLASDGTLITTASAGSDATFKDGQHAGAAYGVGAGASAVWDGLSTTQPTYVGATVGKDGAFAQVGDAASIGSPGVVLVGQSAQSMDTH